MLATVVVLVAVAGWYAMLFGSVDGFVVATDHGRKLFGDFVAHYVPMGKRIWVNPVPTRGFLYSPLFAMALSPLSRLPIEQAKIWWGSVEVAATVLLFLLPLLSIRGARRLAWYLCYLASFVTSYPVLHNFRWGQVSVINVLLVLATAYGYRAGRPLTAALLAASTLCINFYPGLILVYYLARRERGILLVAVSAAAVSLFLVPSVLIGPRETMGFYDAVLTRAGTAEWIFHDGNSQYIGSVVQRLTGMPVLRGPAGVFGGLVVLANLYAMFELARGDSDDAVLWAAALALLSIPFMLRTSWPHYFAYLPFVQLLVARDLAAHPPASLSRSIEWSGLVLSLLLGNVLAFALTPGWKAYGQWGCPFFANAVVWLVAWARLVPKILLNYAGARDTPAKRRYPDAA